MIKEAHLAKVSLEKYKKYISCGLYFEIKELARPLRGKRVIHINSVAQGGGVAEILRSLVPLMRGVGLRVKWLVIEPKKEKFFYITKKIHDSLQSGKESLTKQEKELYIKESKGFAAQIRTAKTDFWVVHDNQPLAIPSFNPEMRPVISRIHIDLSEPNKKVLDFLLPYFSPCKNIIFSLKDFVNFYFPPKKIVIFPPAIDPLASKNQPLRPFTARAILMEQGINPTRPLVAQVSRFDRWKDPIGVIKAYYLARNKIPDLQLALLGFFQAKDDPVARGVYLKVKKYAKADPRIFLFAHPEQIGALSIDIFVNAVQVASRVILQKSIKEGFGLTVTEAMWKGKPVIGGNVGGIKLQIEDGKNGFLVNSPREAARRIVELIKNPQLSKKLGKAAKERVKEKFLIPRLLRDYLKLFNNLQINYKYTN